MSFGILRGSILICSDLVLAGYLMAECRVLVHPCSCLTASTSFSLVLRALFLSAALFLAVLVFYATLSLVSVFVLVLDLSGLRPFGLASFHK